MPVESDEFENAIDLMAFRLEMKEELIAILGWWMKNMVDDENGGFYGRIDGNGRRYPMADKGVILNTRILWAFSAAARHTNQSGYIAIADYAWAYIQAKFIDQKQGGLFWMLDANGHPIETKKQVYAQAFALYAFSEYFLLSANEKALHEAKAIFNLIESYSFDHQYEGYLEAFSEDWKLLEDLRLSEKDANEAKTMNTHLHILEAYTNFYRVEKTEEVATALKQLIEYFLTKFIDLQTGHLHLFFDEHWNLKSDEISFGHDIECSWLLVEAAEVLGDQALLNKVQNVALKIATAILEEGLDKDGALFNELKNDHLDTHKIWWPQAEAVIGFWNAWQLSQNPMFKLAAYKCWQFIKNNLKDRANGEWHWWTNQEGIPILSEDKAGPWKAPYHNGRMCLELLHRL